MKKIQRAEREAEKQERRELKQEYQELEKEYRRHYSDQEVKDLNRIADMFDDLNVEPND